jgi:hypothetical protein
VRPSGAQQSREPPNNRMQARTCVTAHPLPTSRAGTDRMTNRAADEDKADGDHVPLDKQVISPAAIFDSPLLEEASNNRLKLTVRGRPTPESTHSSLRPRLQAYCQSQCLIFSFRNWRCPACDKYLGKAIGPRFYAKCGVALQ